MEYETLSYEQKDAIGVLTLNRPQCLNAINEKMIEELEEFWHQKMQDLDTRVIILAGAGDKGFCAGLDMSSMQCISQRWEGVLAWLWYQM